MIWVGDIGDNADGWPYARIHKVIEPRRLRDADVPVTTYRFTYPGGPVDAEALMADPRSEQLWVISKRAGVGGDLRPALTDERLEDADEGRACRDARSFITDAAMAPDGDRYVVRDYLSAEVFSGIPPGEAEARFGLPIQPQGEAITWTADSRGADRGLGGLRGPHRGRRPADGPGHGRRDRRAAATGRRVRHLSLRAGCGRGSGGPARPDPAAPLLRRRRSRVRR